MYKLSKPPYPNTKICSVVNLETNSAIPFDPDNTDYQAYLAWVAEGGQVLPADE